MHRPRILIGLCAICALFSGATTAWGAEITTPSEGTTTFTCSAVAKDAQFSDSHCTTASSGSGYAHAPISQETKKQT